MNRPYPTHPVAAGNPQPPLPPIIIRSYSIKELAALYGVCTRTLSRWLKPFMEEIGERNGRFYNSGQVKIIFLKLGMPYATCSEDS